MKKQTNNTNSPAPKKQNYEKSYEDKLGEAQKKDRKIRQTVTTPEGRKLTLVSDLYENELMDTNVYDDNGDLLGTIAGGEILDFVAAIWRGSCPRGEIVYPEIADVIKNFQI